MSSEPIPLPNAARRLGITPEALRQRIKRGQIEAFRDNRGRWMVILAESGQQQLPAPLPSTAELIEVRAELARWQGQAEQIAKRLADRDREQQLLALIERMTLERRSLWQELREWLVRRLR